jgi:hypothetical protein
MDFTRAALQIRAVFSQLGKILLTEKGTFTTDLFNIGKKLIFNKSRVVQNGRIKVSKLRFVFLVKLIVSKIVRHVNIVHCNFPHLLQLSQLP